MLSHIGRKGVTEGMEAGADYLRSSQHPLESLGKRPLGNRPTRVTTCDYEWSVTPRQARGRGRGAD